MHSSSNVYCTLNTLRELQGTTALESTTTPNRACISISDYSLWQFYSSFHFFFFILLFGTHNAYTTQYTTVLLSNQVWWSRNWAELSNLCVHHGNEARIDVLLLLCWRQENTFLKEQLFIVPLSTWLGLRVCGVCVFVCHTYKKVDSKLQFRGDCSDTNYLLHMPERNRKWQTHTNIWQSHGAPQFIRFIFQCDWNDDCAETCITCARMRFHSNKRFHSSWRWWRSCFVVISLYIYILDVFIKATLMAKIW